MNIHSKTFCTIASNLACAFLLSGCLVYSNITPTITITPTILAESVSTHTPFPAVLPELTPTWTPTVSLSEDDALQVTREMILTNEKCNFPCYLGIYPGKTTSQEMLQKFSPLGDIRDRSDSATSPETIPYLICIPYCTSDKPFSGYFPVFWVKDDVVIGIDPDETYLDEGFKDSLSKSLDTFGEPDEVWILITKPELNNQPYYDLKLLYQSKGIILSLGGDAKMVDSFFQICPQIENGLPNSIFLFDNNQKINFQEFELNFLGDSIGWMTHKFERIEQITSDFTAEKFFQIYSQQSAVECIDILP